MKGWVQEDNITQFARCVCQKFENIFLLQLDVVGLQRINCFGYRLAGVRILFY